MSDTVPAPAFMSDDELRPVRTYVAREAAFQTVAVAFIRKVVLPPMGCTAVCHENEMSQNARARAKARGVLAGVPDVHVYQAPARAAFLELKWGKNQPSDDQKRFAEMLWSCGLHMQFCWSIADVLLGLRVAGITLHGNAGNIATEYQARAEAAVARAEGRAEKKRAGGGGYSAKPRSSRNTKGAHRFSLARHGL